jgi:AraC family transcriptional regulator
MNGETAWAVYETRLRRVSAHIHAHLDEELDMNRLAEIACMSSYHWHRIYRAIYGETLAATVKRLRLHRAAGDIVGTDLSVAEIAKRSGYPNVQSFNRIFKAVYGMPPARYRREGSHKLFETNRGKAFHMFDVQIRDIPDTSLVGVPHQGSYLQIGKAFEQLFGTLYARGQARPDMRMIGVYLDDPDIVAEDSLRSVACVSTDARRPQRRRSNVGQSQAVPMPCCATRVPMPRCTRPISGSMANGCRNRATSCAMLSCSRNTSTTRATWLHQSS